MNGNRCIELLVKSVSIMQELDTQQKKVCLAIARGENVFVTGEAGSGKTHCVKSALFGSSDSDIYSHTEEKSRARHVIAIAPSGMAASGLPDVRMFTIIYQRHACLTFIDRVKHFTRGLVFTGPKRLEKISRHLQNALRSS